ncbi:MAG: DNA polymerase III subunit alpha [Parcubacteria group bacterium]|nr:DNA polymerase III subunit alpha [Parcubacteria group bacterium]
MKFAHLHVHSHYSLLDGLGKINDLIKRAGDLGMEALALTDHGAMYGALEFYKKAKRAGIKPILGCELYVAYENLSDKRPNIDDKRYHLTVLAENLEGYRNLIQLVTQAHLEGFYYKPRVDKNLLRRHSRGLIALSGCFQGEIPRAIQARKVDRAEELIREYQEIFGRENFYLEIMPHHAEDEDISINQTLAHLSQKTGALLAATNDVHYIHPEDASTQDILISVGTGTHVKDKDRLNLLKYNLSLRSGEEMSGLLANYPGAVERTGEIAQRINLDLELGRWTFPTFELPANVTPDNELRRLAEAGFTKRNLERKAIYLDRLDYELGIIEKKGYAPYFLVVADLLDHAHQHGILTNIRGSVAGSLVTYLTGVTKIDPLEYKVPFERFLNPERPSAPDIDMDFADNRRDEVIEYARQKYGADKVAQVGTFGTMMARAATFGTMMARAAVRDVARALGHPYATGDTIAKLIPFGSQGFPMTIDQALKITPELSQLYDSDPVSAEVINQAQKMEGCARHISVHAAGVVIAPRPLTEFVPLQLDPKGGKIITQYDMHAVEDAGLLKFDFLGIRNLSILEDTVKLAKQHRGVDVDIENIPLDDKKSFALLAKGETAGLFQLNGAGMTKHLKDLKPATIHDINAMVALYRPGPLESIPQYIERKHNPQLVSYFDPRMKEFLEQSRGLLVYQDDVLMTAVKLAGYSWQEADKLRKAMGKKIPKEMEEQKSKLISGLIKNGLAETKAEELWKLIEPFAAYGFNKAHAASYGRVAYQTAYAKANFPAEFMCAVMTAESGDIEKIAETINECARMNIPVLPPDVNESYGKFTVIKGAPDKIRFGLESIKNVGVNVVAAIIETRETALGKFKSLADFIERIHHKDLNKKSLEALAKAGALDQLGERNQLLANMEYLLAFSKEVKQTRSQNQSSIFDNLPNSAPALKLKETPPATPQEKLAWEKELLGLYVSSHPLAPYKDILEKKTKPIKDLLASARLVTVGGMLNDYRKIITKNGKQMVFGKLKDFSGEIELVVFPDTYEKSSNIWKTDQPLLVKGSVQIRNNELKLICQDAVLLNKTR